MCLNPRTIIRPDGSKMVVPCGHCLACLKAYQDQWTARLNEEIKCWSLVRQDGKQLAPVVFFTLDYRPDAIPCTYLVVTDCGIRIQSEFPDCPVHEFWTDTRRETHNEWLVRRKEMLCVYHEYVKVSINAQDRLATADEIRDGNAEWREGNVVIGRKCGSRYPAGWYCKYNILDPFTEFFTYSDGGLEHPEFDYKPIWDLHGAGTPLVAFEFHSVLKSDVQKWNKRGRINLERCYPDVFGGDVNPRFRSSWIALDGSEHELPSCAVPKNVKFFITSEYGPLTHRPHYHGVMFGVTYEEFERCFAADWNKNFGRCEFSVLRPSGGALTYLSKYCSKGCYEHPYACRDIIYPSGKEFHADYCVNCREDFGIDVALVNPTFHLISKGLGAGYAFSAEIQRYFGALLSESISLSGNRRYVASDAFSEVMPSAGLSRLLLLDPDGNSLLSSCEVSYRENGDVVVRRYSLRDGEKVNLIGESVISASAIIDTCLEETLSKTIYSRTYVKSNSPRLLPRWHFIGYPGNSKIETRTSYLPLPRYYRQWLVSPLASLLRQSAAIRLHPSVDEVRSRLLLDGRSPDEVSYLVSTFVADSEIRNILTAQRLRRAAGRDFSPHGFQELE